MTSTPDILQQILQGPPLLATAFPDNSRYHGVATLQVEGADKTPIVYLVRRFVPPSDRYSLLTLHTVREGERLDNITARYLGDPLQFWRICDANGVMSPSELTEKIGNVIRITLPAGVPGSPNA